MKQWSPIVGRPGELRLSMNLTALGIQAYDALFLAGKLGFPMLEYAHRKTASGQFEIWAILLQEFHDYRTNTNAVVDPWDAQIDELRSYLERDFHGPDLILLCNFADYLEAVAV